MKLNISLFFAKVSLISFFNSDKVSVTNIISVPVENASFPKNVSVTGKVIVKNVKGIMEKLFFKIIYCYER